MEQQSMDKLKKLICKDLEMIAEKGQIGNYLDALDKLVHSYKSLLYIEENDMGEGASQRRGYSRETGWRASGEYSNANSYRGNSYDGGMSNSMGNSYGSSYSRDNGMVMERIEQMMNQSDLSFSDKDTLRKAMEVLRK